MDQNENLIKKFSSQPIKLVPFYHDLKNEIIEPEKLVVGTQYFWKKWAPYLGPTLTVLIVKLRMHCYYNKITKEKRDWCYPSLDNLADEVGVSKATIKRELVRESTKYFIKIEHEYRYNEILRKKIRAVNKYIIAMDDPLLPIDNKILIEKSIERILKEGDLKLNLSLRSDNSVDNLGPKAQFEPHIYEAQIEPTNVSTTLFTNNVNNVAQSAKNVFNDKDPLVEDMVNYLGDKKSLGLYRKIAKTCPAQLVYRVLGETKEAALSKKIKTTKGAYFTDLIKRLAKEQNINLKMKEKQMPD